MIAPVRADASTGTVPRFEPPAANWAKGPFLPSRASPPQCGEPFPLFLLHDAGPNEKKLSHRWRQRAFAAEFDIEVIRKLDIGTASGWLQRLVRSRGDRLRNIDHDRGAL